MIKEVEVWGEHYKTIWDRALFGTKVFIGDQLCDDINGETLNEPFLSMGREEGNGYRVICKEPIMGDTIKIV